MTKHWGGGGGTMSPSFASDFRFNISSATLSDQLSLFDLNSDFPRVTLI